MLFSLPTTCRPRRASTARASRCCRRPAAPSASRSTSATTRSSTTRCPQPAGVRHAVTGLLTLTAAGPGQPVAARLQLLPALRRALLSAAGQSSRACSTPKGWRSAPGESWDLEELFFATGPAREPLLGRARRSHQRQPSAAEVRQPPTGWCSWYCFGPQRDRAAGAATTWTSSPSSVPAPALRPDRRRLPAGDGRLARHRQGLRRRRPGRAEADPRSAASSPRSGWRRSSPRRARTSSSSIPTGSSRDDGRHAAARRTRHLRRLAARALVRARRHPPRGAGSTSSSCSARCARSGAAPTSSWTRTSGARCTAGASTTRSATRIEAYRRGMQAILARRRRRLHPRLQSPDLGVVRADPRLAQLGRHQAHLAVVRDDRAAEPEPQLAERPAVVERSGRRGADRRAAARTSTGSTPPRSTPAAA